jgi:hypothetical protein
MKQVVNAKPLPSAQDTIHCDKVLKLPEVISVSQSCTLAPEGRILHMNLSWPNDATGAHDWAICVQEIVTQLDKGSPWFTMAFRASGDFEELSGWVIRVRGEARIGSINGHYALTAGHVVLPSGETVLWESSVQHEVFDISRVYPDYYCMLHK